MFNWVLSWLGSGWKTGTGVILMAVSAGIQGAVAVLNPEFLPKLQGVLDWLFNLGEIFGITGVGHKVLSLFGKT